MSNEDLPKGYIVLWMIVVLIGVFLFILLFLKIGYGKWECVENKTICEHCDLTLSYLNDSSVCICNNFKNVCVKELWTRNNDAND